MSAAIRNPLPLWGLYFLLLVAMFATPLSNLSFLLWIIVPLLALTVRNSARKEGFEDEARHASWIMGSAGLFLLLVFTLSCRSSSWFSCSSAAWPPPVRP